MREKIKKIQVTIKENEMRGEYRVMKDIKILNFPSSFYLKERDNLSVI